MNSVLVWNIDIQLRSKSAVSTFVVAKLFPRSGQTDSLTCHRGAVRVDRELQTELPGVEQQWICRKTLLQDILKGCVRLERLTKTVWGKILLVRQCPNVFHIF